MPANTINVARPGIWGNKFRVGDTVERFGGPKVVEYVKVETPRQAVDLFRELLELRLRQHPDIIGGALDSLRGKNLACWCEPGAPCHADVLLDVANA
jgi:hypothetical protein